MTHVLQQYLVMLSKYSKFLHDEKDDNLVIRIYIFFETDELKLSKYRKSLYHYFFYFLKIKRICLHLLFSFLCFRFVETIFKMALKRLATKYTHILLFHYTHIIYPQRCIMPLYSLTIARLIKYVWRIKKMKP